MHWDKLKRYTYTDYLEWKRAGYRGMELLNGIPYQYGVSVFEQAPVKYPPDTIQKILENVYEKLTTSLKDTSCQVLLSHPVVLNDVAVIPDILITNGNDAVILIVEIAESEKYMRLEQCKQAGIDYYWVLHPDSQCVNVYVLKDRRLSGGVYGSGEHIPIAATGCTFHVNEVWEPSQ